MDIYKKFTKELLKYKNTPFKYFGRSKEGIDCVGLYIKARNDIGLKYYDYKEYSVFPRNNHLEEEVRKTCYQIKKHEMEEGDVILINFKGDTPQHMVLYIGNNKVISANKVKGKVIIESIEKYKNNIHSVYRMMEIY